MDASRCPHCNKPMKAVMTRDGRTGLRCLRCDKTDLPETDVVKWADSRPGTKAA
jgi:tRNA(Ile2) C34 agmatinyltransferase TiaS